MARKHVTLAILCLVGQLVCVSLATADKKKEKGKLPEGVRGFSGQVRGVIVARGQKNDFTFKVVKVQRTWKNNKAKKPQLLAGRTVTVYPRWAKNDQGKFQPSKLHVGFIGTLKPKQELTLELINNERNAFSILELNADQRRVARGQGKE